MAQFKCLKCDSTSFELVERTPSGSDYLLNLIQCSRCGGVVGVLDSYNIGELILRLAEKLNVSI
jgi:DNA-directed RNA polymerase subunit RPC12/RpoP